MQSTSLRLLIALVTLVASGVGQVQAAPGRAERRLPLAKIRQVRTALEQTGLYPRITEATRNDWMRAFPEDVGESFNHYVKATPKPLEDTRTRCYVANLASDSPATRQATQLAKDFTAACFALQPAEVELSLPDRLPTNQNGQVNALPLVDRILPDLIEAAGKARQASFGDGAGFIAVTDRDLYHHDPDSGESLNFVFGLSGTAAPVMVISVRRLGDPGPKAAARSLFKRRVINLAVHEFGHNCGLSHCTTHRCLMNGANSLQDADRSPLLFCPDCLAKLWWGLALDPREHLQQVLQTMRGNGLESCLAEEIQVLEASLKAVAAVSRQGV